MFTDLIIFLHEGRRYSFLFQQVNRKSFLMDFTFVRINEKGFRRTLRCLTNLLRSGFSGNSTVLERISEGGRNTGLGLMEKQPCPEKITKFRQNGHIGFRIRKINSRLFQSIENWTISALWLCLIDEEMSSQAIEMPLNQQKLKNIKDRKITKSSKLSKSIYRQCSLLAIGAPTSALLLGDLESRKQNEQTDQQNQHQQRKAQPQINRLVFYSLQPIEYQQEKN